MITPPNKIQDAINAAEIIADATKRDDYPVTINNGILLALIAGAKNKQEEPEYVEELEKAMNDSIQLLRSAFRP